MIRSLTWYAELARFFPRGKPVARLMARLVVLWQDLLYEQAGIIDAEGFEVLDRMGGEPRLHRQLYFLRGNSRTLCSAKYLLDALTADETFAGWMKENRDVAETFYNAKKEFDRHRQAIERVRNTVGAHAEENIGNAIDAFEPGDKARFEIHATDLMRPHLATEVLLAAITPNAPRDPWIAFYRAAVTPLAQATNARARI